LPRVVSASANLGLGGRVLIGVFTVTGRIGGGSSARTSPNGIYPGYRGANQVGLRASNERLALSLIRIHGQLSKAQIAEITGLTKQTASVIVRSLEAEGLLAAGRPVKGKVGQPSIPMSINPEGALFLGLRLGLRHADIALVDFVGGVLEQRRLSYGAGEMGEIARIGYAAIAEMRSRLTSAQHARLEDIGIAVAADILAAVADGKGTDGPESAWAEFEALALQMGKETHLRVYLDRDAVAACSAELAYGLAGGAPDFLYIFIGHLLDGGIVQHGRLGFSRRDARPGIGRILVPSATGGVAPLGKSVSVDDVGLAPGSRAPDPELRKWIEATSASISLAVHSASALATFRGIVLDGLMPQWVRAELVREIREKLTAIGASDLASLFVREGTSDRQAAGLGAACIPLLDRFFLQSDANGSAGSGEA
jgi:predicted NBD/HSP70 family sugar kinase